MKKLSNNQVEEPNAGGIECVSAVIIEKEPEEQTCKALTSDTNQASFGKFSTADALLKAYNNLEVEFTKRSQELKRLKGENLKLKEEQANANNLVATESCQSCESKDETGIELAKQVEIENASSESGLGDEQIANEVSDFLKRNPLASSYAVEIAQKTGEIAKDCPVIDKNILERAYIAVLQDSLLAEKNKINDDYIYSMAKNSDFVREKIIRDYLSNFSTENAVKLLSGGGNSVIMPPLKPKDIKEAGALAVGVIKKR